MSKILKTTVATAFAAACLAGASIAFAADNGGKNGDNNGGDQGGKNNTAGHKNSKDNKCANDASGSDANANCTTEPNDTQQ
jgi:hypothetical protein